MEKSKKEFVERNGYVKFLKQTKEGALKQIGKVQLNDLRVEHLRENVCDEDAYIYSVTG